MNANKIMYMRCIALFFILLLLSGATSSVQAAPVPVSESETSRIFDTLRTSVPEIGAMARNAKGNRLVMSLESIPDPEAKSRFERDFYHVYVGFNIDDGGGQGHRSRWATFLLNKDFHEILWANYVRGDTYIPLDDWRKYVNGVDAEKTNDFMCIPYMRAGRIEPFSTLDDIARLYGAANVERRVIPGPEGVGQFDVSVIYPDTDNELRVYWDKNEYGKRPSWVSIRKHNSEWKTLYGIKIGTSLAELNRLNGRPFKFLGFNWDYGGSVKRDWEGGVLGTIVPASLVLRSAKNLPRKYQGDKILSSDDEDLLQPDAVWVGRIDIPLK